MAAVTQGDIAVTSKLYTTKLHYLPISSLGSLLNSVVFTHLPEFF